MAACDILVDIGNRRMKVLPLHTDELLAGLPIGCGHRVVHWDLHQPDMWCHPASGGPARWWISSVHRPATARLIEWIGQNARDDRWRVLQCGDFPLTVELDHPHRAGVDRLAAACGALTVATAPFVVVDAGTATTVDLVLPPARFVGGAIFPGMTLMAESLARGTDALPLIQSFPPVSDAPGRDTVDAVGLGIRAATVGGVKELVAQYRAVVASADCPVLVTGGNGQAFSDAIPRAQYHAELVLLGIAQAARHASKSSA